MPTYIVLLVQQIGLSIIIQLLLPHQLRLSLTTIGEGDIDEVNLLSFATF